jgi:hypothetical protein
MKSEESRRREADRAFNATGSSNWVTVSVPVAP